jgi:rubrerythrin
MNEFKSINEILDFAMDAEQEAYEFYSKLASQSTSDAMHEVFEQFAKEEKGHKAKIAHIKQTGTYNLGSEKVADLKIADYTVEVVAKPNMSYQEALIVAMKKEKAAFKLYLDLSEKAPNADLKNVFLALAQEESRHKLRFEIEYDDVILKEN